MSKNVINVINNLANFEANIFKDSFQKYMRSNTITQAIKVYVSVIICFWQRDCVLCSASTHFVMLCYCSGVLCNSAMRSYCCCFCAIACLCSCVIATAILWRRFVRQDLYLNTLVVFTMALSGHHNESYMIHAGYMHGRPRFSIQHLSTNFFVWKTGISSLTCKYMRTNVVWGKCRNPHITHLTKN